jgi:hypothetical protein
MSILRPAPGFVKQRAAMDSSEIENIHVKLSLSARLKSALSTRPFQQTLLPYFHDYLLLIPFFSSSVRNTHRGFHEAPHDVHGLQASSSGIRSPTPFLACSAVRIS